jgi:hypothetical protein
MINLKVLGTAAAIALVAPLFASSASFAQDRGSFGGGVGGMRAGGGGAGTAPGFASRGGGRASFGGGAGGMRAGGGAPATAFSRSAVTSALQFNRGAVTTTPQFSGGSTGGRYAGGHQSGWNGYRHHGHGGDFWPGAVAGAVVGGALASNYYYGGPYYGPGYSDDSYAYYDDDAPVAVEAAPDGDASYCAQRYRSYDPASGTYLGHDGRRHPCP